jgi:hypothetical protein
MPSLAQRRRAQTLAERAALDAGAPIAGVAAPMPETGESASEYRILLAVLHEDLRQLAGTQSVTARNPIKLEMALKYADWVKGALEAGKQGKAAQDEIVITMMIWMIDFRAIDDALDIAAHVLAHGLILPERYQRTAGCFVAEEIATVALAHPEAVTLAQLQRTAALTADQDMPDQARAKLFKALGRASAAAAATYDPQADNAVAGGKAALLEAAIAHFAEAIRLNKKVGAIQDRQAAEAELAKLAPPPA